MCARCGSNFSKGGFWSRYTEEFCPECHFEMLSNQDTAAPPEPYKVDNDAGNQQEESVGLHEFNEDPLVVAQNRTTHAIRSLAIALVVSPIIYYLTVILENLAINHQNKIGEITSVLVGVLGELIVLVLSYSEFAKSEVI